MRDTNIGIIKECLWKVLSKLKKARFAKAGFLVQTKNDMIMGNVENVHIAMYYSASISPWVTSHSSGKGRVEHGSGKVIFMEKAVHPFLRKCIGGVCDGRTCWCTNIYIKAIINIYWLFSSNNNSCNNFHYLKQYMINLFHKSIYNMWWIPTSWPKL